MAHFEYQSFTTFPDELQAKLQEQGKAGWRLHTCDPYVVTGNAGVGTPHVLVVMDKVIDDEPPQSDKPSPAPSRETIGMAMKG